MRPYFLALLAEAFSAAGQEEQGLAVLAVALAVAEKTGERLYEAELWRLKGELMLKIEDRKSEREDRDSQSSIFDPLVRSETCFLKAIEIARHQHAKSWELRAAMSLSRLWQRQGKGKEARKLLAAIYDWFTEGFDTADLRAAWALLDELG